MEFFDNTVCFLATASPGVVAREKEKARALRKTQWWQRQIAKGICFYCRKPTPPKDLTMDHVVPLIRNGHTTRGNVVPACKDCNNRKKYMLPIEWEGYLGNSPNPASLEETPVFNNSEEHPHGTV